MNKKLTKQQNDLLDGHFRKHSRFTTFRSDEQRTEYLESDRKDLEIAIDLAEGPNRLEVFNTLNKTTSSKTFKVVESSRGRPKKKLLNRTDAQKRAIALMEVLNRVNPPFANAKSKGYSWLTPEESEKKVFTVKEVNSLTKFINNIKPYLFWTAEYAVRKRINLADKAIINSGLANKRNHKFI